MRCKLMAVLAATIAAPLALAEDGPAHHDRRAERVTVVDGKNTAAVNAQGELSVTDRRLTFDASGALKTATQGSLTLGGTVGISESANTVKLDPQNAGRTAVVYTLADSGGTEVPLNGIVKILDVSPYGRIRVAAANLCTSVGSILVDVRGRDSIGWILETYTLAPCDIHDRIYDLPGATITVSVYPATNVAGARTFLQVFGR